MRPTDTFELKTGNATSYVEYMSSRYGIKVRCLDQPLLRCIKIENFRPRPGQPERVTQSINLIPELCAITGKK